NTIPGIGVRIFPAGVEGEGKNEKPRNRDRRDARGLRRTLRRRRGRKLALRDALRKANLLPADEDHVSSLMRESEHLELRVRGLDHGLQPFEFGRALIHLAQRRGFKSNRRKDTEKEQGKVLDGIKATQGRMLDSKARTIGELLFKAREADSRA